LATLELRIARQTATAREIDEWAQTCRGVQAVYYPGLPSHPDHAVAAEQLRGSGTMLMIDCIDDERGDRLREMVPGVEEAASTDTRVAPLTERRQLAIHIGLESVDAVRASLGAALE
jgi:cystathionine beta-lyase/cystathionine gamma-synthase